MKPYPPMFKQRFTKEQKGFFKDIADQVRKIREASTHKTADYPGEGENTMMTEKQMNRVMMLRPVVTAVSLMLKDHISDIQHSTQIEKEKKHELTAAVHDAQMLLHTLTQ